MPRTFRLNTGFLCCESRGGNAREVEAVERNDGVAVQTRLRSLVRSLSIETPLQFETSRTFRLSPAFLCCGAESGDKREVGVDERNDGVVIRRDRVRSLTIRSTSTSQRPATAFLSARLAVSLDRRTNSRVVLIFDFSFCPVFDRGEKHENGPCRHLWSSALAVRWLWDCFKAWAGPCPPRRDCVKMPPIRPPRGV